MWRAEDPQGDESSKCKYEVVQYTRGIVLDLGCGPKKAFPHFVGVDSRADTELFGIEIKPDVDTDCAQLQGAINDESVDAIFSSHLLEHIEDYEAALASWWRCIKPGGHLVLYLPHKDLYPNIGQPGANVDHKHDFLPEDIEQAMTRVGASGWDLLVNEVRSARQEYSFLQVYRKRADGVVAWPYTEPKAEKTVCVCRFGGFGDMIQAANILPELKRQGYHVTVMTTPKGADILANDPHVDAFLLQDNDQVPNHELVDFWEAQARRFTKFINLSESVEGTLLAFEGRTNHMWSQGARHAVLDRNYLEFTALLAELPYTSESRFYPSPSESERAERYLKSLRLHAAGIRGQAVGPVAAPPTFNLLWCLAGSSVHKMYPHQDAVMHAVLKEFPEITITLVGDELCQLLEQGWENHPRVHRQSGKLSIRDTLTLAQHMDCVVGPETGVLNAVAFEPMGKVLMLSHSSVENLSKHWVNTASIVPPTGCHPCHRLHHGRKFCPEHEGTGASMCAFETNPEHVTAAIAAFVEEWRQLRALRTAA